MVLRRPGGVNSPSLRALRMSSRKRARSAGSSMYGLRSSAVNFCRAKGGGFAGNGCVGQVSSSGHVGLGHRPLFDGPQRLAGHAIEHPDEALLADLRHDVDRLAVVPHGQQFRRGGVVVIPDVVVDHLEMPEPLAGAGIEREQAIAEQIGAFAVRAVEVVFRAGGRECRRCRASRRGTSRPTRWRRRRSSRRPSATCRSRTRRDAGWCGTSRPACRCARR